MITKALKFTFSRYCIVYIEHFTDVVFIVPVYIFMGVAILEKYFYENFRMKPS